MLGSSILKGFVVSLTAALAAQCAFGGSPTPTGFSFTYQGVLKDAGSAANGTYFLRFQLWDALSGGAQVGADINEPALAVTDGLFTSQLNFGALAFNGEARWLQVQVITNGGSTVTTLSPRQPLNAAPFALFALAADGSNVANLNASNIVSGNLSTARLPAGGAWALTSNLNLDANTLVVDQANNRLGIGVSDPGAKLDVQATNGSNVLFGRRTGGGLAHNLYIDGAGNGGMQLLDSAGTPRVEFANGLTYFNYGNVGIGTSAPAAPLHVRTTGPFMVLQDNASAANQAGYLGFWNNAPSETAWVGFGTPGSPHFSIVNARAGGDINLSAFSGQVVMGDATISAGLNVGEFLIVTDDGSLALFDRIGSDGPMVDFRKSGVLAGTISVTGTTVTYGAFTGCHYGWSDTPQAIERGELVMMTGENRRHADDPGCEPIYGIKPSIMPNDPRCLGAYLGLLEPTQPSSMDNPHQIMAVGNGDMWVVESTEGTGGRGIQPGDYLISSDVEGHAMLDDPTRFPIGHVVARAAEAVNWEGATESVAGRRHRRISVFFENFERGGTGADDEIARLNNRIDELERLLREALSQRSP